MGQLGEGWSKWGQFTSNLRGRWTIPITTGGCQVSRREHKGNTKGTQRGARENQPGVEKASGNAPCIYATVLYVQRNNWMLNDTSYRVYNNNQNECC